MFISKKEQKALQILTFVVGLYVTTQKEDLKTLELWEKEGASVKKLKNLKEMLAERKKIIKKMQEIEHKIYSRLPNTTPARKLIRDIDKKSRKLIVKEMQLFNRLYKRAVYVELDYIAKEFLRYLYGSKILNINIKEVQLGEKLMENPLSEYKKMSEEDKQSIDKFIKRVFETAIG